MSTSAARTAVSRQSKRYLRVFWERAYRENITGLSAMVAYNLALAIFPFALLVLFIFGRVIQNPDVEASVLRDLQSLFPAAEQSSLASELCSAAGKRLCRSRRTLASTSGFWMTRPKMNRTRSANGKSASARL